MTLHIQILNPNAKNLLNELEKLNLIRIKRKDESKPDFLDLVKNIRQKNKGEMSLEEISKEVEAVRLKRYQNKGK